MKKYILIIRRKSDNAVMLKCESNGLPYIYRKYSSFFNSSQITENTAVITDTQENVNYYSIEKNGGYYTLFNENGATSRG